MQWSVELRRDDGDRVWAGSGYNYTSAAQASGAADNLQSSSLLQPEIWAQITPCTSDLDPDYKVYFAKRSNLTGENLESSSWSWSMCI